MIPPWGEDLESIFEAEYPPTWRLHSLSSKKLLISPNKLAGQLDLANLLKIAGCQVLLKAPLVSRIIKSRFFFVPDSLPSSVNYPFAACSLDLPCLNPNCLGLIQPSDSVSQRPLKNISFSKILPKIHRRLMGLKDL